MSMLSAAALLDELMGVDRNRAPNEKKTALHWSDPQVVIWSVCFLCVLFLWVFVTHSLDMASNVFECLRNFSSLSQVCKHFLCGFCPCQLFVNTRSDLGEYITLPLSEEVKTKVTLPCTFSNINKHCQIKPSFK